MKEKIIKSILDLLILQLLKDNTISGNQIAKEITEQFGAYINPATIRAAIIRLKNDNLIAQITGKVYTLAPQGERIRTQMKKDYLHLQRSIEQQLK